MAPRWLLHWGRCLVSVCHVACASVKDWCARCHRPTKSLTKSSSQASLALPQPPEPVLTEPDPASIFLPSIADDESGPASSLRFGKHRRQSTDLSGITHSSGTSAESVEPFEAGCLDGERTLSPSSIPPEYQRRLENLVEDQGRIVGQLVKQFKGSQHLSCGSLDT